MERHQTGEMAHLVKESAAKPDHLSLTPGTQVVEKENQLLQVFL